MRGEMGIAIQILKDFAANGQGYPAEGEQGFEFSEVRGANRLRSGRIPDLEFKSADGRPMNIWF